MNVSYYTAVSGLNAFQTELDVTANNISNIDTRGYKEERSNFDNLLYTQMDTRTQAQVGHGVRNMGPGIVFDQGIFETTERNLDFAIMGKAFFAVETDEDEEEPAYTRDGSFQISATDDGNFLTTRDGKYVLDRDGERVELEYKTVDGNDGTTSQLDLEGLKDIIGRYTCENPDGLVPVGNNRYRSGETSGEWESIEDLDEEDEKSSLLSGRLEVSSVEMASEMVNLMQAQRAFQLNSRIVVTADQMEEMINNLR